MNLSQAILFTASATLFGWHLSAQTYVDLGGPATGSFAIIGVKSSSTQNGIEGKDSFGNPTVGHNGLPDYPNFQQPGGGNWSAIIASPLDASSDYSGLFSSFFPSDPAPTVNNQTETQPDAASLSAGRIEFTPVSGVGLQVISVGDLTFVFDTYTWDGSINGDGGDAVDPDAENTAVVSGGPFQISPLSPVYTPYNDASGFGNAAVIYNISVSNPTGTGLTFQDGVLTSMDITADLSVQARLAQNLVFPVTFTGTFSASGLSYSFDVADTQLGFSLYSDRKGNVTVVPEPSSFGIALAALAGLWTGLRRKKSFRGEIGTKSQKSVDSVCEPEFVLAKTSTS
ncbi:MAG: hypothetical protein AAGJ81_07905 [Verrucomicrobiota bacterium]